MTRTEWDWLLGKPSDETMIVIDDGVLAMLDEYVKKQSDAAFKRGVEAMREAAAGVKHYCDSCSRTALQRKIRALPDPEDK